uniref:beta strand repeat-containing protein n=1 Tax=Eubacterium cellulosolvens TaxID=29322 RepID=UPI0004857528
MRIKMKRFLGILLTLTLMLGLMPGMSLTVYASTLNSDSTTWSENSVIAGDVTINNNVTVNADITLTIPAGKTLTINGQSDYTSIAVINDNSHTLTVCGGGTLIVNAPAEDEYHPRVPGIYGNLIVDGATVQVTGGEDGVYGDVTVKSGSVCVNGGNGKAGGNGYSGISGFVIVNGGSITVVGGNGGNGDTDSTGDGGSGGYGVGNVIVNGGSATITGGNGGTKSNAYAFNGSFGQAVNGSITGNAEESDDNINWTSVTGRASQKQYIKFVPILVTGVSLDKTTAQTIDVDGKVFFTATVTPENASDKTVKWSVGGTNADAVKLYSDENCTTEVGTDATSTLTVYAKGESAGSATVTCTSNADNTKSSSCNVTVNAAAIEPVSYMEASVDGTTHAVTFTDKSCTDYTVVDSSTTTWGTAGTTSWYVVNSDVTIDSAITFTGDVHLILGDGVTLTVNNNVKKSEDTNTANLTIYGQDAGTGALNVTSNGTSAINNNYTDTSNYNNSGGNIKINGGKITASATGTNGHGIYATGDITINGGEVNAEAIAQSNAGIWASGGTVTINGGKITAKVTNGGIYGTGILGSGVIISDGEVIAVGNYRAIDCNVKNEIAGTGWTNTEGTEGKADIEISESGQNLESYKKVQFQAVHEHSFTYDANGATITATCANTDGNCTLPESSGTDGHVATLTISANGGTYDGTTGYGATITDDNGIQGDAKVQYQKKTDGSYGTATETVPTDAGDYKASITVGGATASVEYTIAQADPTATAPTGLTATYGQTLANVSLEGKNPEGNTPGTWAWADSTQSVGNVVTPAATFKATFTPDSSNYKTVENVEVTVTTNKAAPTVTAPTAKTLTYAGTAQELVNAGSTTGGTMQYALGTATEATGPYTTSIPTATDVGTYYVWYMVIGDENHVDSEPASVTVAITENMEEGKATFEKEDNASAITGVDEKTIGEQMQEIAEADATDPQEGQTKSVTVTLETKAVPADEVPQEEKKAIDKELKTSIPDSYAET